MQTIIILTLVMGHVKVITWNVPIKKVNFNPIFGEKSVTKEFGVQFAKVSHEMTTTNVAKTGKLQNIFYPNPAKPSLGFTSQRAKLIFPLKTSPVDNLSSPEEAKNFISLPIFKQPFNNYKILIATAPPQMRLNGKKTEPTVIYVVYADDDTNGSKVPSIPSIYFVNKHDGQIDLAKKEKADPILIVDSNRTVTGLKSKEISKYINFRSKFAD